MLVYLRHKITYSLRLLPPKLSHYVKSSSMTQFSIFMLMECDDACWLWNFRMKKQILFAINNRLKPLIRK